MNYELIFFVFSFIAFLIWVVGFIIYAYHVFAFGLPEDATRKSLYILIMTAMTVIIIATFYLSAINWSSIK